VRHACGYALANKGHDTRALQACGPQKHPSTQGVTPNYCQGASKISGATRPSERICPYAETNSDVVVIVPAPRRQANCARDTNMNTNTFVYWKFLTCPEWPFRSNTSRADDASNPNAPAATRAADRFRYLRVRLSCAVTTLLGREETLSKPGPQQAAFFVAKGATHLL
jgi:hypothetical protein